MDNVNSLKSYFSAELILIFGLIITLFLSLRKRENTPLITTIVVPLTLVFSLVAAIATHFDKSLSLFAGMVSLDPFGQFFKVIILITALAAVILSSKSRDLQHEPKPEFFVFLLSLTIGLLVMTSASDLLMIYLAIEMSSLSSYVMAGYLTDDRRSEESGLKYVLYGGVASGIMIFGISLLYGLTGTLNLVEIREYLMHNATDRLVLFITFIMILAGLGYKMAIAPFHMWSPDVYEGAPMPVTAFLSVASKAGGFAVTLRFFIVGFLTIKGEEWEELKSLDWQTLVAWLAAITMTVGNVLALQQSNIKRFLAYSSVAHAGYLLMGVAVQNNSGIEAVMFYFVAYLLMNMGAFFVATLVANQFNTEDMNDYKGLARQNLYGLFLSLCLTVFLFSLTGIPPFAGFVGKWYLFKATLEAKLIWLAVVGALNSVLALFYYVRLVKYMLMDTSDKAMPVQNSHWRYSTVIALFALFSIYFGIYFGPIVRWAKFSAQLFYAN